MKQEDKDTLNSNQYIEMQLALSRGGKGEAVHTKVKRQVQDEEGNVGNANNNPLLDSQKYKVEYVNRYVEELTNNIIVENLIAQVNEEGQLQMMSGISIYAV